jgi:succinate-acetate transporter protein
MTTPQVQQAPVGLTDPRDNYNDNYNDKSNGSNDSEGFPRVDHTVSHRSFRHDDDHIYINEVPISKKEFTEAFGGAFEVGPREKTKELIEYANPVPAGLGAFSASAISLGLVQMHARHVHAANTLLGAFLTTSGLGEIIVGILCFVIGNTWAACTFLMFGGFWSSYAFVLMNVGGIAESYATTDEYAQSVAIFFLPWAIFSFCLWLCTLRSTLALSTLMFFIWFFVFLFTIAQFIGSVKLFKAGGFFAILAGVLGFYNMFAGLADRTNSYFVIKPIPLPNQYDPAKEA